MYLTINLFLLPLITVFASTVLSTSDSNLRRMASESPQPQTRGAQSLQDILAETQVQVDVCEFPSIKLPVEAY